MTNTELGRDRFWTKKYSSLIEAYTPGAQTEPEKGVWKLLQYSTVFELWGYVNGELWHIFCEDMPQVEGMFLTFWLNGTKYFIPANHINDMRVIVHRSKTFYKLENQDKETGVCTVRYWSALVSDEEAKGGEEATILPLT